MAAVAARGSVSAVTASSVTSVTASSVTGEDVVEALLSASRALVAMSARSLAELDEEVSLAQFRALVVLATRGPQRVVDVSRELDVVSSTGTRLCERLVRRGWVRRTRSRTDRRAVRLALTPAGRRVVDAVFARRRADLEQVVAAVPARWHASLVKALAAFTAASGDTGDDQWWLGWAAGEDD